MKRASKSRAKPRDVEVAAILKRRYPSFAEPLKTAWSWNRAATSLSLARALKLLDGLKRRYPNSLQVRYERALALVKLGNPDKALKELRAIDKDFTVLDEDTYSLWGRIYKDRGDQALNSGNLLEADREYREALDRYLRGFRLSKDRFPGINVATLQLVLASVLAIQEPLARADRSRKQTQVARLRSRSEETARKLLATRRHWKQELPDDHIWVRATEAEACLLLLRWKPARKQYESALGEDEAQSFHLESMRAQCQRILDAFTQLGVPIGKEFEDLDKVFVLPAR